MAGDEDRDRVVPDRPADSLRGQMLQPALRGQLLRDPAIGRRFAIGDRQQNVPYRAAERRTARVERRQSCRALPGEVAFQPTPGLCQNGSVRLCGRSGEAQLAVKIMLFSSVRALRRGVRQLRDRAAGDGPQI